MAPALRALRYMTQFRCLAERCPDTCCVGMRIGLDAGDVARLERALGPAAQEPVDAIVRGRPGSEYAAELGSDADGACRFLDPDRLCSIVKRFGEAALPDACSLYPRALSFHPDRVEIAATLSCPEAARLCLLGAGSTDMLDAGPQIAERIPAQPPAPARSGAAPAELAREVVEPVLSATTSSLRVRLGALALLAQDEGALAGSTPDAGAELRGRAFESAAEKMAALPDRSEPLAQALFGILTSVQPGSSERYSALLNGMLGVFHEAAKRLEPRFGQPDGPSLFGALMAVYRMKSGRADAALGGAVDVWLTRYALNEWHREWHTRSPSFLSYAFKLCLRTALARLAIVGHPFVDAACASIETGKGELAGADRDTLQLSAVEAVQILCRRLERDAGAWELLDQQLSPEALQTDPLGRALLFASLC